jgi:hypothetical protein
MVTVTVSSAGLVSSLAGLISTGNLMPQIRDAASPDFYGIAPNVPFMYTTTIPW